MGKMIYVMTSFIRYMETRKLEATPRKSNSVSWLEQNGTWVGGFRFSYSNETHRKMP